MVLEKWSCKDTFLVFLCCFLRLPTGFLFEPHGRQSLLAGG